MALVKLSHAIKAEYDEPYPDRETALKHFQARYHCEKRGPGRGQWYVDRAVRKLAPTGNQIADDILRRIQCGR